MPKSNKHLCAICKNNSCTREPNPYTIVAWCRRFTHFNPKMITLGRKSRGITQKELAGMLSVTHGKMSKIENGLVPLSEEELDKLSHILKYPRNFFTQTDKIYDLCFDSYRIML